MLEIFGEHNVIIVFCDLTYDIYITDTKNAQAVEMRGHVLTCVVVAFIASSASTMSVKHHGGMYTDRLYERFN